MEGTANAVKATELSKKICKNGKLWGSNNSYNTLEYKKKLSLQKIGKNNPNFKDGNSYRCQSTIYLPIVQSLAQECSVCGTTKKLITHHIDFNYKNNTFENITIVCRGCHNKIHKSRLARYISGVTKWKENVRVAGVTK